MVKNEKTFLTEGAQFNNIFSKIFFKNVFLKTSDKFCVEKKSYLASTQNSL